MSIRGARKATSCIPRRTKLRRATTKKTDYWSVVQLIVCCVAARSSILRRTSALPTVSGACRRTVTSLSVSVRRGLSTELLYHRQQTPVDPEYRLMPTNTAPNQHRDVPVLFPSGIPDCWPFLSADRPNWQSGRRRPVRFQPCQEGPHPRRTTRALVHHVNTSLAWLTGWTAVADVAEV